MKPQWRHIEGVAIGQHDRARLRPGGLRSTRYPGLQIGIALADIVRHGLHFRSV